VEEDTRQALSGFGRPWNILNMPDSQAIENRYGDAVEWLYGSGLVAGDAVLNAWPHVSRFYDATGLSQPDPWKVADSMKKFDRYMQFFKQNYRGREGFDY